MCDDEKSSKSKKEKGPNAVSIAARVASMGLAVAAAALMATANECTVVLPNGAATHTVTYSDFSPFVYLVAANAMAAVMVGLSIFLGAWKKGEGKWSKVLLPLLDAAVPAMLYSATGAAFAAQEYMSYCAAQGRRVSVCAAAGSSNFCSQVRVAIYLSLGAASAISGAEVVKNVPLSLSLWSSAGSDDEEDGDSGCGDEHACNHH